METTIEPRVKTATVPVINSADLLSHWQGHRRLTKKVIEAFPEDKLFDYSVAGMRPFAELSMEIMGLTTPGIWGVVTGEWEAIDKILRLEKIELPDTKEGILQRWDEITELLETLWSQIPAERFRETDKAFGAYEGEIYSIILYWIDNEVHHRGQGYVYLRSLGIEPPAFWNRA